MFKYVLRWAIGAPDFIPPTPLTPSNFLDKAVELSAEVVNLLVNLVFPYAPKGG